MPTLDFKGKQLVYACHLAVSLRPLEIDAARSLPLKGEKPSLDDNLVIHGDNLHALKALLPKYAGRVNCVYIDPPYNTGNESWAYNDNANSPALRAWLAKTVGAEDLERHDKWLCMMWPRLRLLRELLAEDGVIFISIDDNEQHRLRAVMDEIFGEGNFVANIIWRKKTGGGQDSGYFAREHDYVVCYRKSASFKMEFRTAERDENEFNKRKEGGKCRFLKLEKWGSNARKEDRPTMFYPIKDPDGNDFFPKAPDGRDGNWRTRPTALDRKHIHWEKKKGRWTPYEVIYFDEVKHTRKIIKDRTIFYDLATTADATNEQKQIWGEKRFDNSKPAALIYRLARLACGKESVVLDSFAGSATTAHAVLALNKKDGGRRRFILVECEDYADKITAERVRRVIKGVGGAKDPDLKTGLGGSFTYCTLGKEINIENMPAGKSPPDYETMARFVYWTATGRPPDKILKGRGKDGLFCEAPDRLYYLIYEPASAFRQNADSALDADRARRIAARAKKRNKPATVFATRKFIDQKDLSQMRITFCGLPPV